jgi:urate oxidase
VNKYSQVKAAHVEIQSLKWSRLEFDGKGHDHSFVRDGDEKQTVDCLVDASTSKDSPQVTLTVGLKDLLSMFSMSLGADIDDSPQNGRVVIRGLL